MFSSLLVCLLAGLRPKNTQPIFKKFGERATRGPRKIPLVCVVIRITLRWGRG